MSIRLALLGPVALISITFAQAPEDRSAAIKEALARNQAALRQYSWIETTTISLKGEILKTCHRKCGATRAATAI